MIVLKRLRNLGLPLLMKELHEQSARSRTFVVRVGYALLLLLAVAFLNGRELYQLTVGSNRIGSQLGVGLETFRAILWMQFAGIYLFLPAMVSGVLTVEKERNTLGLLLITKLSPWTIIVEKFASRIIPMLTFLLISLPLVSFTYALGGVETGLLLLGVWFLFLCVLQVGSTAMLASSFFRGTAASFFGTYLLLAIMYGGIPLLDTLILDHYFAYCIEVQVRYTLYMMSSAANADLMGLGSLLGYSLLVPPMIYSINFAFLTNWGSAAPTGVATNLSFFQLLTSIPILLSIVINLSLARFFLVRRAFLKSSNPLLSVFKWIDRIMSGLNDRFASGVIIMQGSHHTPGLAPVAWRETTKSSLGQFRYLVRLLITLEFPTLLLVWNAHMMPFGTGFFIHTITFWTFSLWVMSTLFISVTSTNLIAGERSRQTLDVLLTTPISSRDLILQKLHGVQRLIIVCSVPLLTLILFQTWQRTPFADAPFDYLQPATSRVAFGYSLDWLEYLVTCGATLWTQLHLIMWLSFWIGMRLKSTSKAILFSLGTIIAWCVLSIVLVFFLILAAYYPNRPSGIAERSGLLCWFLFSPAWLVCFPEFDRLQQLHPTPFVPVILNSLLYGGCWYAIRRRVLATADAGLGRILQGSPT